MLLTVGATEFLSGVSINLSVAIFAMSLVAFL
jgi:hypothetical protein